MAYTLDQIYLNLKEKYHMELLAGTSGIKATVSWVHMVETAELVPFLRRRELVITTGIRNESIDDLRTMVEGLAGKEIAGLIVNLGPYIPKVPEDIVSFCEAEKLPLFTLPWEVRLVEFSHDVCRSIVLDETEEEDVAEAFLDGIMFPGKLEESLNILSRHGYERNTVFQLFVLMIADGEEDRFEKVLEDLRYLVEKILNNINEHYILFVNKNTVYVAVANYNPGEAKLFIRELEKMELHYGYHFYCGVNPATSDFEELTQYFERSSILLRLARVRKMQIAFYENMETYKLLLSVGNMRVLEDYHKSTVGLIRQFDSMNSTNLFELLCQYFQHNGRIQDLAEAKFVHRNTIHYQLAKAEKIMGIHLDSWDDRLKVHLGLLVDELL